MPYKPREGSIADCVITHLTEHGGELSTADVVSRFAVKSNNITSLLKGALDSGVLVKRKDADGHVWYGLGNDSGQANAAPVRKAKVTASALTSAPADADADGTVVEGLLTLARWSDGDLVITGHATTEDGAAVLTRVQVKQLLLFVLPNYALPGMAYLMNEAFKQQLLGD